MNKFKDLEYGEKFVVDDIPYIKIRELSVFGDSELVNAINLLFGTRCWFEEDDEVRKSTMAYTR